VCAERCQHGSEGVQRLLRERVVYPVNPVTGGPAMPTIGCYVQLLRPGEHTQAHRHTSSAAFHVIEGSGYAVVDGQRLDWEDKDVFCVPGLGLPRARQHRHAAGYPVQPHRRAGHAVAGPLS